MAEETKQYKEGVIGIYKANKKNTGSVAQFKLGSKRDCVFLETTRQVRPMDDKAPYDWDKKIIVKLGETDLCKLLAYLNLDKPAKALSLYHESPDGGNKGIELKYQEYEGRPGYYLSVSHQREKGGEANRVGIPIGIDEAEYLRIGFSQALIAILNWN